MPFEFVIFAMTLLGVAAFHNRAMLMAGGGLAAVIVYKILTPDVGAGAEVYQIAAHFAEEWVILANLLLLLLGFAVLSSQFEHSNLPEAIPSFLPRGWAGGFILLVLTFCLSIFLDNIAGAIIGGVVARHVYRHRVGVGFQAAIVAASNSGGAGSVIGDTTTTMMWINGVNPLELAPAFIGALAALAFFGPIAAVQQQKFAPIGKPPLTHVQLDWTRATIVLVILAILIITNVVSNSAFPQFENLFPVLGLGLWAAIALTSLLRRPDWSVIRKAAQGAAFLVTLVALASLMPVDRLPEPSSAAIFGLGIVSAVFDNIPLTALALTQGGYDWALLAYAVGFGGSMVWFGSSAGVALTNLYPEGRSIAQWVRQGWHVPLSYIVGFIAMLLAR